jgi:hypothetical protein
MLFCLWVLFILGAPLAVFAQEVDLEAFPRTRSSSSFLETEAGIAAWAQVNGVNLDMAENALKTVEVKTSEYIIGSVALESYDNTDDVHVYADTAGYVVAYFLRDEKPSKIIDWKDNYTNDQITGTKVGTALQRVCNEMSVYVPDVNYCDFRYPDAQKMMIITDKVQSGTVTFRLKVPSEFIIYNRSWSHLLNENGGVSTGTTLKIDDTVLNEMAMNYWNVVEGELSITQLSPNEYHVISLSDGHYSNYSAVGIVLLYKE